MKKLIGAILLLAGVILIIFSIKYAIKPQSNSVVELIFNWSLGSYFILAIIIGVGFTALGLISILSKN